MSHSAAGTTSLRNNDTASPCDTCVLGFWDGHDAGAALLEGDRIVFAVNEERLSRRKLEVGFPCRSILACLESRALSPGDIRHVAVSTSDPAKTLTRLLPGLKEEYYLIRRRKKAPRSLDSFKKWFKYRFTELEPNPLSRLLSRVHLHRRLSAMGFQDYRLHLVDHHLCHAQAAARCSGFDDCAVLTLDGVGDGLSGLVLRFTNNRLFPIKKIPASVSLGIFFEHVTNLMNMRELEDEGKVMALANYAYPIDDADNPLMPMIRTRGLELHSPYSSTAMYREMKRVLWRYPSEQFAFMAQRALERNVLDLVRQTLAAAGTRRIALAGGVFSNIKVNMRIAELDGVEGVFVFPHMGDGGLAVGAAMEVNARRYGVHRYSLGDLYLGPRCTAQDLRAALERSGFPHRRLEDPAAAAARRVLAGDIILWYQGRMELGPRALGNRSILARPDDRRVKDRLNLALKKRVWYQPFCPSMLLEDAPHLLHADGRSLADNRFMTTGFRVRPEYIPLMEGVMNVDSTCRPHLVGDENPRYRELLLHIRRELGRGVVLNTSFNIHGEPIVSSPGEALDMLRRTGIRYLFMEDFIVENEDAKIP